MLSQLRRYRVRTEDWDEFVDIREQVLLGALEALGFRVDGVWGDRESGTFGWVVSHEAADGWEAVDRAYYESPERQSVPRDPRELLLEVDLQVLAPLTAA